MKVALVGVSTGIGGSNRYCEEMYNRIGKGQNDIETSIVDAKMIPYFGYGLGMPIRTLFRNFSGYDIVHNLPAYPFYPLVKGKAKIVTTAYEFQTLLYPDVNTVANRAIKDRAWDQLVVKPGLKSLFASDFIISISIQTMNEAIKLGVPRNKIAVATYGIDERFTWRVPAKKKSKDFKVGYLGSISPRKNSLFAINSFKKLIGNAYALELWGRTMYSKEELVAAIGKDKRIELMGPAPNKDIIDIYNRFDAFVFPSLYEGFGGPILEARALGLPVIIYKQAKISPEVKKYCFEAENEEDMAEIITELKENGYNEKTKRASMAHARMFTWKACADKIMDIYRKLI
jgi:glycosyltransferase involved in cell wall biosynthesis